ARRRRARARRKIDHAARARDAPFGPAALADEHASGGARQPVRGLHDRAALRVPVRVRAAARHRRSIRVLERRLRASAGDAPLLRPPRERTRTALPPERLEPLVGRYALAPGVEIAIAREGERLFATVTGQLPMEIVPASDALFFYKAADAEITFEPGQTGRADALVLHQAGQELRAERID